MADFNVRRYLDPSTKGWIVTAIGKLASQIGQLYDDTRSVLEKHVAGTDVELRQVSNQGVRICQPLPFYNLFLSYCLCIVLLFPSVVQKFKNFLKTPF